jgi:hypothetical protein
MISGALSYRSMVYILDADPGSMSWGVHRTLIPVEAERTKVILRDLTSPALEQRYLAVDFGEEYRSR